MRRPLSRQVVRRQSKSSMALTLKRAIRLMRVARVPPQRWVPRVTRRDICQRLGLAFLVLLTLDAFFWFVIAAGDFGGLSSSQSAILTASQAAGPVSILLLLFPELSSHAWLSLQRLEEFLFWEFCWRTTARALKLPDGRGTLECVGGTSLAG